MGGDGNLAPMSEDRYVCIYMSFYGGGALLSRTGKDIPKIFVGGDTTSVVVCRMLCEKNFGGMIT